MVDSDISRFVHIILSIPGGDPFSVANKVPILNVFINKRSYSGLHGSCTLQNPREDEKGRKRKPQEKNS